MNIHPQNSLLTIRFDVAWQPTSYPGYFDSRYEKVSENDWLFVEVKYVAILC